MEFMDDSACFAPEPSGIRKGRFLKLAPKERIKYVENLKKKIASGYYYSEAIISGIVEEMTPAFEDAIDRDMQSA